MARVPVSSPDSAPWATLIRCTFAVTLVVGLPTSSRALDYLEHSYFTDRACVEAQTLLRDTLRRLERQAATPAQPVARRQADEVLARYLALGLMCPQRWDRPYCGNGYKNLSGTINPLPPPPPRASSPSAPDDRVAAAATPAAARPQPPQPEPPFLSITLGDFAALADHLSQYGPIVGVPRLREEGLIAELLTWLEPEAEDPGGVVGDVAEDACETDDLVDWDEIERDVGAPWTGGNGRARNILLPPWSLSPLARAPVRRGPADSPGPYSFDNPHYLDLVLSNHHHFGQAAYDSWLGFHGVAHDVASRTCKTLLFGPPPPAPPSQGLQTEVSPLKTHTPSDSNLHPDWSSNSNSNLDSNSNSDSGCRVLHQRVASRIQRWLRDADPILQEPAAARIADLSPQSPLIGRVVSALLGLALEGVGLHFLQDSVAGGHLRVDRAAYGLGMSRHMHDADGKHGVAATLNTARGPLPFVAFGDGYLLGRAPARLAVGDDCALLGTEQDYSPQYVTACLLRTHRGILVQSAAASLLDFVLAPISRARGATSRRLQATPDRADQHIMQHLMVAAPYPTAARVHGKPNPPGARALPLLRYGTLPEPPPEFAYQSISTALALRADGAASQSGLRLVFLSTLDAPGNWMTSWHSGVFLTHRKGGDRQWHGEFSYMFHWRWAARFLINAGPYALFGIRARHAASHAFAGVGPSAGVTLLPEGWIKMPLEATLTYRAPVVLLDQYYGWNTKAIRQDGHWIELTLGLAFL